MSYMVIICHSHTYSYQESFSAAWQLSFVELERPLVPPTQRMTGGGAGGTERDCRHFCDAVDMFGFPFHKGCLLNSHL